MSGSDLADNPFAALFPSLNDAEQFLASYKPPLAADVVSEVQLSGSAAPATPDVLPTQPVTSSPTSPACTKDGIELSALIERIFLITLNKEAIGTKRPSRCVFLADLHDGLKGQVLLDMDTIYQAVFERLMLAEPSEQIVVLSGTKGGEARAAQEAGENQLVRYLCQCYIRAKREGASVKPVINPVWLAECEKVIISNAQMCFQQPEIFGELKPAEEFLSVFQDEFSGRDGESMCEFFETVAMAISSNEEEGSVSDIFRPALDEIKKQVTGLTIGHPSLFVYSDLLLFFTRKPCLAKALLTHIRPVDAGSGKHYEQTLIGAFLSASCIVTNEAGPFEFFNNASRFTKQEHDMTETQIHQPVSLLNERIYQVIYNLLKHGGEIKHGILDWLGKCLSANRGRAKLWSHFSPLMYTQMYASDGFFINLCAVLLRLCKPFSEPCHPKLLKVRPTFCQATDLPRDVAHQKNVHMLDLAKETCLLPREENEAAAPLEDSYSFVCECFYLAHIALNLGFHVVSEKFLKRNQELHRIQTLFQEIASQGGDTSDAGQRIKDQMEKGMTIFLCMKAALTEPQLLERCFDFLVATATYLTHISTSTDWSSFQPITFPLPDESTRCLENIPELIAENILDYMMFLHRFKDTMYEMEGNRLNHLMTFILVFMGSPHRMHNPHLRARLAECLEALMPPKNTQGSFVAGFHREQLFVDHPLVSHLGSTLFHVFVSIEMTGQGVQFEQKFNYRRPMYKILEYIWNIDHHKMAIQSLAEHAERHIEDADAPLFLRFINLLINDATFLLDEALQYLQQIRENTEEKESGAWNDLPAARRQENEGNLRQIEMLARFHNLMGNSTIHSLQLLTSEIKSIFTHSIMVDRITSTLNYFLLHLVGPKKKNLKVKDFDKYDFKPQELVANICAIYLNLGSNEEFCLAVTRDGRSYSHSLFIQAEQVLRKIRQPPHTIMEFVELGVKIKGLSDWQQMEEDVAADAPEEYLDPIMGTLMKDPVKLPSGNIVDKATIARHILSDQTDPFNRQPLTMEMVIPDNELRERIQEWLQEKRQQSS